VTLEQGRQDVDQEVAAGSVREHGKAVAVDSGEIETNGEVEQVAGSGDGSVPKGSKTVAVAPSPEAIAKSKSHSGGACVGDSGAFREQRVPVERDGQIQTR
jgi:hypothetical protein